MLGWKLQWNCTSIVLFSWWSLSPASSLKEESTREWSKYISKYIRRPSEVSVACFPLSWHNSVLCAFFGNFGYPAWKLATKLGPLGLALMGKWLHVSVFQQIIICHTRCNVVAHSYDDSPKKCSSFINKLHGFINNIHGCIGEYGSILTSLQELVKRYFFSKIGKTLYGISLLFVIDACC